MGLQSRAQNCTLYYLHVGTQQFLVYDDDVTRLGGSIHTIKENAVALVVASKETGLESILQC